jgi:hypothetical protein
MSQGPGGGALLESLPNFIYLSPTRSFPCCVTLGKWLNLAEYSSSHSAAFISQTFMECLFGISHADLNNENRNDSHLIILF